MAQRSPIFHEGRRPRARRPRRARVLENGVLAGVLEELDHGYRFTYDRDYLDDRDAPAVSLTLPKRVAPYVAPHLFPFFCGLLAEGSLKDLQCRILKLDEDDAFGRLVATAGGDVIGSVTIEPEAAE